MHVISEIGQEYVDTLKAPMLQKLINRYAGDYSYSTVKKIFEAIRACLEYAVQTEVIYKNPMKIVVMPRRESCAKGVKEIVVPTTEEIKKLFEEGERKYSNGEYVYTRN